MSVTAGVRRRRRRSGAVSTAVLAVIALVITGFAVNFDGLSSSEVEVSDGGVWVLNEGGGLLGRLNVDAHELDARLSIDRKSTRLNSSHVAISYAVFCLKKKIKHP